MLKSLLYFSFALFQSSDVQQDPPSILGTLQGPATITCSHSSSSFNVILWYQKPTGGSALKLVGHTLYESPTMEDEFKDHFNIKGDGSKKSELHVEKLQPEDSSTYYCAASRHSDSLHVSPSTKSLCDATFSVTEGTIVHLLIT
uniref:Ig-like domain-containing protein n=1 Tax=Poecilia mexicana TaxID=48701 RepID=A0A3B3WQ61_9TELE